MITHPMPISRINHNPFYIKVFTKKERQKYSRARNRIEAGIEYHGLKNIRIITLTTKAGTDMDWQNMRNDLKTLMKGYRRNGYNIEYIFSPELSPRRKLLHLHGMFATKETILEGDLSDRWERIHAGSFRVFIERIRSPKAIQKYVTKHILKGNEQVRQTGSYRGYICSRGWLPNGWNQVRTEFIREGIRRIEDEYVNQEQENVIWNHVNRKFLDWCKLEGIMRRSKLENETT